MPPKKTFEEVKEVFEKYGYEVISDYINSRTKMDYYCPKHQVMATITYGDMLQGHTNCKPCLKEKLALKMKYRIEDVKDSFKNRGYELLSTSYENNLKPLDYYCPKHDTYQAITYAHFLEGKTACVPCYVKKRKSTCLERYGVTSPSQNEEIKERTRLTNQLIYGVDSPSQSVSVKRKAAETFIDRYGFPSPLQNEEVKVKIRKTMVESTGWRIQCKQRR